MKKILAMLLTLALTLGLLAGCGSKSGDAYVPTGDALLGEDEEPADLRYEDEELQSLTLAYYPNWSMNPLDADNITNRVLFSLIYQPLFAVSRRNVTYPILCSGYRVSEDRRTYTFFVDSNARFSDGTRVTVEDVQATYEAARLSSYYSGRFTYVDSTKISDDGGLTFYLTTAYQNFPILLDIPILKASEVDAPNPLGSGPYTFDQVSEEEAQLNRVQNWWCTADLSTAAETINLITGTSQMQIRDEFQFGDLDLACANPMSDSFSDYRCDFELWYCENGVFLYLGCNVLYSDYFKDDGVNALRKALTYAIDRDYINTEFYNGLAQPSTLPTSPGSPYYNSSLAAQFAYDPMKFVDQLSGYQIPRDKKGETHDLRLLVNKDDSVRLRVARYLAETLTEFGIPTETLEYNATTYRQVLQAGNFDLYLGQTKLSATMDLSQFYKAYGNNGWGGIADNTLLNMTQECLADSGNYYNLNQMVAEDAKIIPILFGNYTIYAERGQLLDLSPSRDNVFYYNLGKTMSDVLIASN